MGTATAGGPVPAALDFAALDAFLTGGAAASSAEAAEAEAEAEEEEAASASASARRPVVPLAAGVSAVEFVPVAGRVRGSGTVGSGLSRFGVRGAILARFP